VIGLTHDSRAATDSGASVHEVVDPGANALDPSFLRRKSNGFWAGLTHRCQRRSIRDFGDPLGHGSLSQRAYFLFVAALRTFS
jgi:hypothetical protein